MSKEGLQPEVSEEKAYRRLWLDTETDIQGEKDSSSLKDCFSSWSPKRNSEMETRKEGYRPKIYFRQTSRVPSHLYSFYFIILYLLIFFFFLTIEM